MEGRPAFNCFPYQHIWGVLGDADGFHRWVLFSVITPSRKVPSSSWFVWNFPRASSESPMTWEAPPLLGPAGMLGHLPAPPPAATLPPWGTSSIVHYWPVQAAPSWPTLHGPPTFGKNQAVSCSWISLKDSGITL